MASRSDRSAIRTNPVDVATRLKARRELRVALCIPMNGLAGIWGPSSLASAELAVSELNKNSGIAGYPCKLTILNATDDDREIEANLEDLVQFGEIDALVGMCTSSVRQRLISAAGGRVPFVYTPMYEGGERSAGVFAIGETTDQQLRPAISWLSAHHRVKRWAFIGNDYLWPRASNTLARQYVVQCGGAVIDEQYLPLGTDDFSGAIEQLCTSGADAVLVSLIGQDQVDFNRAFGDAGLSRSMDRLSCTVAENELLAIGAENTDNLFVASSYFAALDNDANRSFKERYYNHFGDRAPTLNAFGESTYEGMHFLAALIEHGSLEHFGLESKWRARMAYPSARGGHCASDATNSAPIYIARADGHRFSVLTRL